MSVTFHELKNINLKNRKALKPFIHSMFLKENKTLHSMDIIFCSDEYLLQINKQHLNHDYYTDIITFDLSESITSSITAELYISIDRVKENAINNMTTLNNELHRVIFHGALHLCGYKDKSAKAVLIMRAKEEEYLKLYFNNRD